MFTGIITATGRLQQKQAIGGDLRVQVKTDMDLSDVQLGDSIATNGVCLTVIDVAFGVYAADISKESLSCTTVNAWQVGQILNLEKAMQPTTRFGGHIVSGHVDGVGEIIALRQDARSIYIEVSAPVALAKYLAAKGSITVDGMSLTINHLRGHILSLNVIPHTAQLTNINTWQLGSLVNLEVDILARYVERLLLGERAAEPEAEGKISLDFLAQNGFLK